MAGLYLHIPFCKQACHYCDFHFSTNSEHRSDLISCMVKELSLQKDYLKGERLETIYFGGGTPSLLTTAEMETLLQAVHSNYPTITSPEITVEANPDDLTSEKLVALKQLGVNRLSIGIQSFDDAVLKFLNRAHDSYEAVRCVDDARVAGFNNISVDLIYAIPGQNQNTWEKNMRQALLLLPEHLSSYSLTIEEKTVFGKRQKKGTLHAVEEDLAAILFERLMDITQQAGYEQYEISNFCKPGFYSRHNSSYWKQKKYLGIGPSAHSYDGPSRQFNVSNNALYSKAIEQDNIPFEREVLTQENKINEYIFTTLRTVWGCDLEKVKLEFGVDLYRINQAYLGDLQEKGMAVMENQTLKLTRSGKLLADRIASDLFIDGKADS